MKKLLRWPTWTVLAALALAALVPAVTILHAGKSSAAHAAGNNPTISMPDIVHPFDTVTITGQGFYPGDIVSITIDNPYNYPLVSLSCNSSGNCSGVATIPNTNVAQGTHQVIGTDNSGLSAQLPVTFLPGISTFGPYGPSLTNGGPGTTIQLEGGAFTPGETISIYWGFNKNILEGTTTTSSYDGSFSFTFNAPVTASTGNHPITVVRSQQMPATVTIMFNILPPKMISSAGVRNNQAAHVQLSGFAANEQVALSWNANGGQTITTFTMDGTGALDTYFAPPFTAKGSYTLLAVGSTSQLQATSNLNIGPGILLSLNTENPGGTTTVNGGGYTPGETVNVYFQSTSNGVTSVTVDASGSFSVALAVPVAHKKNATYYVYAVSTTTTDKAKAQFFYTTPSIQSACCYQPYYGDSFTINGQGFAAQEIVTISAQSTAQKYPKILGTATAAADGAFSFTSTMPSAPYATSGYPTPSNLTFIARGSTSKLNAYLLLDVRANIIPTPDKGSSGQKIQLKGGGFVSGETVTVWLQSTQVATATANANGGFSTTFVVPASAEPGNFFCNLCAAGSSGKTSVFTYLIILPTVKMTPKKGPSGTIITVSGNAFSYGDIVSIYWYDPSTNTQTLLTTINLPAYSFQTTVTAPANLTSGNTYDVIVQDAYGFKTQIAFLAT